MKCKEKDPSQHHTSTLISIFYHQTRTLLSDFAMGVLSRFAVAVAALYVPLIAADTPASQPRITSVQYSGNGCPNDASRSGSFNDPTFTYNRFAAVLPGVNQTVNCEIHVQAAGASAGWQVALSDVNIDGHLVLDQGTRLDYYTTVYYSENAGSTVWHFLLEHKSRKTNNSFHRQRPVNTLAIPEEAHSTILSLYTKI